MGWQARSRGTYEERKAAAIKRNEEEKAQRIIAQQERQMHLRNSPRKKRRLNPLIIAGVSAAMISSEAEADVFRFKTRKDLLR